MNQFIDKFADRLEAVLGPVIAQLVINLFLREAKLSLSDEQIAELQTNRVKALAAKADDVRRAENVFP